jgi:hypothetical protein
MQSTHCTERANWFCAVVYAVCLLIVLMLTH